MKIVIDARMIASSTGRYVERLLHYLEQIDERNEYTVLIPTKDLAYWTPTKPNFKLLAADFKYYSSAEQTAFLQFLNGLDADLVHFTLPQQPVLYAHPHVTTFHDLTLLKTYNSDKNWFVYHFKQVIGRFVFHSVARSSRAIITPSEYTKREVAQFAGVSEDKITVTYEAADVVSENPQELQLPSKNYLLYVGQQSDYKNVKRLIEAHQELLKTHPDLLLVLAGGRNKALTNTEAWVAKNGFKNVHFTGFVSNDELAWLYKNSACYVFPSLMEGFGLPGLEAMRMGAPVASSSATCLPEIYGDAAHYFDPESVEDMTARIGQILTDFDLRAKLIERGTERVKEFSWERMAHQTLAVYRDAV